MGTRDFIFNNPLAIGLYLLQIILKHKEKFIELQNVNHQWHPLVPYTFYACPKSTSQRKNYFCCFPSLYLFIF